MTRSAIAEFIVELPELKIFRLLKTAGTTNMSSHSKASAASNVIRTSNSFFFGVVFACLAAGASQPAMAQKTPEAANMPDFAPAMLEHMHKMRRYKDPDRGAQHTPPMIDRFSVDRDPKGAIASFQPNGATVTSNNAFFKDMGTNGRTCFTCHQPQSGWSVTPGDIAERMDSPRGQKPRDCNGKGRQDGDTFAARPPARNTSAASVAFGGISTTIPPARRG